MQEDKFHIQSFEKGMNQDLNLENSNGTYLYAKNFRINSTKSNKLLGLTNDIRNSLLNQLPEGHIIIGSGLVRDTVVLFSTLTTDEIGGTGWIWTFNVDKDTMASSPLVLKYFNDDLKFSTKYPIECIGIYENESVQRIYFSDYFNKTRAVNLATLSISDDIESTSMFIDVGTEAPIITDIISGGTLPVGVYQYFYFLVTPDGKETLYSPNSTQIHLVPNLESVSNSGAYFGSASLDTNNDSISSGKSVKVRVDVSNIPTGLFQKIALCVLYKSEYINTPTIYQIEQKLLGNNQYVDFVHSNNELSSSIISFEDYSVNSFPFLNNKTFAVKDNNLVISNVKTEKLNLKWDTQCFRYKLDGVFPYTVIPHEPYKNYLNDESGKAYGDRPSGVYNDWLTNDQYLYQSDGVTLGGISGDQSVRYRFILKEIGNDTANNVANYSTNNPNSDTDYSSSGFTITNKTFNSFGSPFLRNLAGYKRGETYRFGIVGKKGSTYAFVNYIGDIKFPEVSTPAGYETIAGTGIDYFPISRTEGDTVYLYSLGIEFTVIIPEDIDIDSYEIVRVPRINDDKTRLCSGVISKFFEQLGGGSGTGVHFSMSDINDIEHYYTDGALASSFWANQQAEFDRKDLVSFFSPETTYDFNSPTNTGKSYLKVSSILEDTTKYPKDVAGLSYWGAPNTDPGVPDSIQWITKGRTTEKTTRYNEEFHWEEIKAYQRQIPGFGPDTAFSIDGELYRNYSFGTGEQADPPLGAPSGSCLMVKLLGGDTTLFEDSTAPVYNNGSARPFSNYTGKAFLIDFIRLKQDQYGGIGVEALTYNTFISITNSIINSGVTEVFGGDTFVGTYEFMKNYWDSGLGNSNESFYEVVMLPIETSINLELNHGRSFLRGSSYDHDGDGDFESYRSIEEGMFKYNSVFSSEFMSRSYFTKPFDFKEQNIFDVRSYLSDPKIIGESIDSWSKFRTNNFLDGEANLGPINRIHSYLNEVFFLQDKGVGYITINPRAITNTTDGQPTELGSAEGLIKYNYLSKDSGSIHQRGSLVIPNGLVYYDGIKQSLGILKGTSSEDLSVVKGMDSHFKSLSGIINKTREEGGDNPLENAGVHLGKNLANEEVYVTSLSEETKNTIVYNYRWDMFTAFYSFTPNSYIHSQKFIMSPNSDNDLGNEIYIHNKGLNGILYGNTFNSEIESIITESPGNTKVVKYIQYDCINKDVAGNYLPNEGLDTIRLKNDYQDTGVVSLTNRQRNRFNVWKIKRVPRNSLSLNKISRVRSDWFTVNLGLNNTNNRDFNLERIITVYRLQ